MKKSQEHFNIKKKYVSIIKLNGVPILPPLITAEKSKELHRYKKQAIKIEHRLNREKDLRVYIDQFNRAKLDSTDLSKPHKNEITNYLIDTDKYNLKTHKCNILQSTEIDNISEVSSPKPTNLTCNIQVSQYTNNEFKLFEIFGDKNVYDNDSHSEHLKPKLIRSNSYTLDTPSPVLVEHLRKNHELCNTKLDLSTTKRSWSLENVVNDTVINRKLFSPIKEQKTITKLCIENQIEEINKLQITQINSPLNSARNDESYVLDTSGTESELKNISCHLSNDDKFSDTLISDTESKLKDFIDNNVPLTKADISLVNLLDLSTKDDMIIKEMNHEYPDYQIVSSNINKSAEEIEIDSELQQILSNIPEEYSKQIMELLEKQKFETIERFKSYEKIKDDLLAENYFDNIEHKNNERPAINFSTEFGKMHVENPERYSTPIETSPDVNRSAANSGRTLYYTMSSINENVSETDVHSIKDMEFKDVLEIPTSGVALNNTYINNGNLNDTFSSREKGVNCNRELFPMEDLKQQRILKQEKAATVLGAATRGFLIRRIMRTERVQSLIQTIKDALMCAMQLHAETIETIVEADVELHRRCIQQVSAACEAFHEVFFALSTSEQMLLIAVDRQKQIDRLRKPFSSNSGISTPKSTPRSIRNRPFSSRSIKT